jgi:hypothetical protein
LGSGLTDATHDGRSRRVIREFRYADARMLAPAIVAACWPGGSIKTSASDAKVNIQSRSRPLVNAAEEGTKFFITAASVGRR